MLTEFFELYFLGLFLMFLGFFFIRKQWVYLINLLSATLFGITLEFLSIIIYDGYHYSLHFIFQVSPPPNNVPLVIGTTWGIITISAITITDHFKIKTYYKPFIDTLLALALDLSMDVIAIRIEHGFWKWGIPLSTSISSQSYYGVPWPNYVGWYFVILIFSTVIRYERSTWKNNITPTMLLYSLLTPLFSYIPLYLVLEFVRRTAWFFNTHGILNGYYTPLIVLFLITTSLTIFISELKKNHVFIQKDRNYLTILATITFFSLHFFYLTIFILTGYFYHLIVAGIISLILFILDVLLHIKTVAF